jgi:glycosyltransferase involved in cell wall biosynthesis
MLRVPIPQARLYHAPSTGYAGVLASIAKLTYERPVILTEHGIYTKERRIEIMQADWIYSDAAHEVKIMEGKELFREWWLSLFVFFSRVTYQYADKIITLYEGNQRLQLEEGADPDKCVIIPNGIRLSRFKNQEPQKEKKVATIGFAGRVVPIKDVKTFIRACKKIRDELKNVRILIMGPTDEDEEYYQECVFLTQSQGLQDVIEFKGKVDLTQYYPQLDVLVLTSISEAQPIVVLEAGACGVPVVTTDVGDCAGLVYGKTLEDRRLGASGIITPICDAQATADAVLQIIKDQGLHQKMAQAGRDRVYHYYQQEAVVANYQSFYSNYLEYVPWPE